MAEEDDDSGLGFTLPPMHLPPLTLPDRIRLIVPVFDRPERPGRKERSSRLRVSVRSVLVALLVLDVFDAVLALGEPSAPWLRVVVGAIVVGWVVGPVGVAYLWEAVAVVAGVGWLAVVPSATLLFFARFVREIDLLGRRHPEQVDGHAEGEREHPHEDERGTPVSDATAAEADHAAQHERRGDVDERDE
ncbi:hypothetical protein [Haladaptatus sp. NG-SE-30]